MVNLTRDAQDRVHARLLDLVPGCSGRAYVDWLAARTTAFRAGVKVATLDPFHGYNNAIGDQLEDATAVLDAFHVVKLGTTALDDVRRRVQTDTAGHRGRTGDPLHGIGTLLRAGAKNLTPGNAPAWTPRSTPTTPTRRCSGLAVRPTAPGGLPPGHPRPGPGPGREVLASLPTHPIPEIVRLGRTLRQWSTQLLAYFDTGGADKGGTDASNGLIELHHRGARGFRNRANYRLRMLLIVGGLTHPNLA